MVSLAGSGSVPVPCHKGFLGVPHGHQAQVSIMWPSELCGSPLLGWTFCKLSDGFIYASPLAIPPHCGHVSPLSRFAFPQAVAPPWQELLASDLSAAWETGKSHCTTGALGPTACDCGRWPAPPQNSGGKGFRCTADSRSLAEDPLKNYWARNITSTPNPNPPQRMPRHLAQLWENCSLRPLSF